VTISLTYGKSKFTLDRSTSCSNIHEFIPFSFICFHSVKCEYQTAISVDDNDLDSVVPNVGFVLKNFNGLLGNIDGVTASHTKGVIDVTLSICGMVISRYFLDISLSDIPIT